MPHSGSHPFPIGQLLHPCLLTWIYTSADDHAAFAFQIDMLHSTACGQGAVVTRSPYAALGRIGTVPCCSFSELCLSDASVCDVATSLEGDRGGAAAA